MGPGSPQKEKRWIFGNEKVKKPLEGVLDVFEWIL
jgi:hypothetical protein